jgi:hypothetical protein
MNEKRRVFDFIMGGCAGFCFFYGQFLGYALGALMLVSHVVMVYRQRMLESLDRQIKEDTEK